MVDVDVLRYAREWKLSGGSEGGEVEARLKYNG